MQGGTTFHFITNGIKSALEEAKKVAQGKDVVIGGGVSTIRQFIEAGYIDEIEISFSPVFLGSGENLFSGIDMNKLGLNKIVSTVGEGATHLLYQEINFRCRNFKNFLVPLLLIDGFRKAPVI